MTDPNIQPDAAGALVPLDFEGSEIRIVDRGGELWFVAKDVATVLGYANAQDAVRRHCKNATPVGGARNTHPESSGGASSHSLDPQTVMIPERDVYRLIMRSKLPSAERFEEWVVGEVLPSIRRAGAYALSGVQQEPPLSRSEVSAMIKGAFDGFRAEMGALIPQIAKAFAGELAAQKVAETRFAIGEGYTAGDVATMAGITNRKGLRGLSRFISFRLARYHRQHGVAMREGRLGDATATVFDPNLCRQWLREGGKAEIERYVAEKRGQGTLKLSVVKG